MIVRDGQFDRKRATARIGAVADLDHRCIEMSPGIGIETHISAIAAANADDVAIGEAKLQYVAGPGLADDQYRLAGRDGFARFDQATPYDAVAGRYALGMAAVALRGIELCARHRGRGAGIGRAHV